MERGDDRVAVEVEQRIWPTIGADSSAPRLPWGPVFARQKTIYARGEVRGITTLDKRHLIESERPVSTPDNRLRQRRALRADLPAGQMLKPRDSGFY